MTMGGKDGSDEKGEEGPAPDHASPRKCFSIRESIGEIAGEATLVAVKRLATAIEVIGEWGRGGSNARGGKVMLDEGRWRDGPSYVWRHGEGCKRGRVGRDQREGFLTLTAV